MKTIIFSIGILVCGVHAQAQRSVLFEAGTSYFSNDIKYANSQLSEFFSFSFNTRVFLSSSPLSAFSLDFPFSVRNRFKGEIMTRFALHLPVMLTYNVGAGASAMSSDKKIGGLAGLGFGFFYQQARAGNDEVLKYDESLSAFGPQVQIGARIPLRSIILFHSQGKPVSPNIALKTSYLIDTKSSDNNIGLISLLIGLQF
jgi:hypothetical protein